jgi:hypothetical protein
MYVYVWCAAWAWDDELALHSRLATGQKDGGHRDTFPGPLNPMLQREPSTSSAQSLPFFFTLPAAHNHGISRYFLHQSTQIFEDKVF